jgi:hypothetical protein
MAYTPPLGNAVNFNGSGAAYTPPLGNAVDFDIASGVVQLGGLQADAQRGVLAPSIAGVSYTVDLTGLQAGTQLGGSAGGAGVAGVLVGQQVTVGQGVMGGVVPMTITVVLIGQSLYVNHILGRLTGLSVYANSSGIEPPVTYYAYPEGQSATTGRGELTPVVSRFVTLRGLQLQTKAFSFIVVTDTAVQVPLLAYELAVNQGVQYFDWLSRFRPLEWVESDPDFSRSSAGEGEDITVATHSTTGDAWTHMPPVVLSNGDALVWGGKRYFELAVELPPEGAKPWPVPPPPRPPYNSYLDPTSYAVAVILGITFRSLTHPGGYNSSFQSDLNVTIRRDYDFSSNPWDPDLRPGVSIFTPSGSSVPPWPINYAPTKRLMFAVDVDRDTDYVNWGKLWLGYDGVWFADTSGYITFGGGNPELGAPPLSAIFVDPLLNEPLIIAVSSTRSSEDSQFPPPPVIPIANPTIVRLYARGDKQLHRPIGFYPWDEAGPRHDGLRLTGSELLLDRGYFAGLGPPPIDSLQAGVQTGAFILTVGADLVGLGVVVERGTVVASRDILAPLTGQEATVQQSMPSPSKGQTLAGQVLTVGQGALAVERGVTPAGLEALVLRGMFPGLGVEVPLPPSLQATVERGALAVDITVQLTGQSLVATTAAFVPAFNLHPVGLGMRVDPGVAVPLLHPFLSGSSMVASNGALKISLVVTPTGLQATVQIGQPDFLYDCNLFLTGVQAIGKAGVEPTQTNVPPVSDQLQLWAKAEVEKLFNKVEPLR